MISIIIPTYNRCNYLFEAVNSCLNQTYNENEIIIIDDGSTDNTEQTVSELLKNDWKDKNIRYVKQLNSGASAARNHGFKLAEGEFIQFLDSDDFLFKSKLELQLNKINETKADGCSCFGLMGYDPKNSITIGESFNSKLDLLHRMCSGKVHVMQTSAPLWRRSLLEKTNGWNTNIAFGDDLEFHIRMVIQSQIIEFIEQPLFFLRIHESERLSDVRNNIKQIESGIRTQQLISKHIIEANSWDKYFQTGILKNARTLYANFMELAPKKDLKVFEGWIIDIAKTPQIRIGILLLILFRKIFGAKIILNLHRIYTQKQLNIN